jgi:hypothetical protein
MDVVVLAQQLAFSVDPRNKVAIKMRTKECRIKRENYYQINNIMQEKFSLKKQEKLDNSKHTNSYSR